MYKLVSFVGQDDTDILGHFLAHYRKLGIGEFHIFIHGNWTQADLAPLRANDVTIAGVVQNPFDEIMKSSALDAYAAGFKGEWLLFVDADEFLELPYGSIEKTIKALNSLGVDELPAFLLQRASADGSLPEISDCVPLDALFPCYDSRLAERMNVKYPIWKNKYPLVRVGAQFRLSRGFHLPTAGRPAAHIPFRGILHHYKWRDRLLRSISRIRGENANQHEQDAYRIWLEEHDFRLPTIGLKRYSRQALFKAGHLVRPTRPELLRLSALHKATSAPKRTSGFRMLESIPPTIRQNDEQASQCLNRRGLSARPGRIALVTPEILGLRVTGGIGTAMAALAERLSAGGHEVHVFFIPHADSSKLSSAWSNYWDARGVRIHYLQRRDDQGRSFSAQETSLTVCAALIEGEWDVIHLPDAGGLGAATLLHRVAGLAFQSTQIALTVHGPSRWHRGGNLLPWTNYEAEISQLEAISIDLADVLIFPSAHMLQWCKRHFSSPAPHLVIPNSLTGESRRFGRVPAGRRPVEKIVFFGRLELRKGIDRFLSAIELVLENGLSDFEVIFLGSFGRKLSEAELARRIEHWTCKTRLLLNYTTHEAVDLLRTDNCLAVMPSRVDNSPYTVYECLENGIPFIASDVGGIPELVRDEDKARVLVSGEAEEYAIRLRDALENGASPAMPSFNPDQADLDLLSLHGNLAEAARLSRGRVSLAAATRTSVIVYGAREPDRALALVLRRWAQDGVEIFWHGDPSSAQSSGTNAFPFFTETRAAALNRLARSASGDHILFCHASVVPRTESLTAMLAALAGARADVIVCGYQTAGKNGTVEIVPIFGGTPELSATHNDYGAKLFLVRKARFLEGGGFATEPEIAEILEWEFLNRLKGPGGRVFAIPAAMASVIDPAQPPLLSEYQLGRLTAPWVESAPEPLQGFIRMALHQERNAGQPSAQPAANRKRATEDVAASPDVRGLELAGLLARRAQSHAGQTHSAPQDSATLSVGQKAGLASAALKNELVLANPTPNSAANGHGDSPLAAIEGTWSEENELGRQGIGSDGRLLRPSTSYVIQAVEDAEGCDFLVADSVADVRQCRSVENTFREIDQQMARRAERSPAGNSFLRFEEVLAAGQDAAALVVDAVRRATELTARFYGLTVPVYPTQVKIAQVGAGTFIMPRRPILVPRGIGSDAPQQDFAGLLCLSDDVEGGETYFTTIDIAVKPKLGRYIGCTASPYHERAVLRVNSGTLLTLSFVMRSSADDMSPGLRRLY